MKLNGRNYSVDINEIVIEKLSQFDGIYIPHPRMTEILGCLEFKRQMANATPGRKQMGVRIFGPSGSGKTTAVKKYIAGIERRDEWHVPVLYIEVDEEATPRQLFSAILRELGDAFADGGTTDQLRHRAAVFKERAGVELIIIDELQHLVRTEGRGAVNTRVANQLKKMLNTGWACAFVGTPRAMEIFDADEFQLSNRVDSVVDLPPLDLGNRSESDIYCGYLGHLDRAMVQQGLVSSPTGLLSPHVLRPMYKVSKGVVGIASGLVRAALEIALRDGRTAIQIEDLSLATDRWAIPVKHIAVNPFGSAND